MRRRQWLRITLLDQQLAKQANQNLIKKRIVSRTTNKLSGEKIAYICERLVGANGYSPDRRRDEEQKFSE